MAINLKFDLMDNPEPPSIILANRNGNKLGQLNVDDKSIDVKDLLETSEFSFRLNKYIDNKPTPHWDKVVDFKCVYCPEWDLWYEIKVELDEATETVKTVFCTQLGQAELSQIKVYNTEINTEADIARDDYKISILYDEDNKDASTFHRVMSKAPHYSIAYIDESLKRIQKSFSFDDLYICDVFDQIEEEVGCLVVYNSNSDKNGMPKRDISIYDLYQHCDDCGHREEFIGDECPKCHSKNIIDGYGEDTTIFVTSDELATEGIQLVTDTDSVKNCFKLEAGDDLMTATIRNCNPNGSDYIWYFSDAVKEDMSKELVEAIESYDNKYKEYYDTHISNLDASLVSKYNALVEKYKEYYNTSSTCLNCDYKGEFEKECPSCHSGNILTGKSLQTIDTPITGYPALMNAYYNTIDLDLYLESGLMPNVEMSDTNAMEQLNLLTTSSLSPVAVNVEKIENVSLATANSAVLSMVKVIVRPTYKIEIKEGSSSLSNNKQLWSGQFVITNYSDETDTATNADNEYIDVTINIDTETFIQQKINKALNKENTDDYSISGLFAKEYDEFCAELKKYALNPLDNFSRACDDCLSILHEQGVGDDKENPDLYEKLYKPYFDKQQAINNEIKIRQDEIAIIEGVWDKSEENNPKLITEGLQQSIEKCKNGIQDALNFEDCLGKDLWLEFCAYRREDKYSNNNYISDGLNNAELFEKALEFIEVAENEIFKSAELQHSISATLNNLLAIPKFKPLIKHFKTGNWIRVQVDDRIFKLRLLERKFSYSDLESIPVEFSDVTKIKNGTTDVKDIISQAASMASSYDSVQRQAKKGDVARNTIDQWLVDGLSAANMQIQNNNSEEVLLTKNGLLARSYSDITGGYSPEQLKITHNIIAYTDDDWRTVKQAIGKHNYKIFDKSANGFIDKTGYGMTAEFVNAGYVSGSQIIGGDIYSDNYSITDKTGSYLNLRDGTFSFGGGSLRYEGGKLLISSPDIPTTDTITEINEEYLKTTTVYAEGLQVKAANIQEKLTASQINADGIEANNVNITGVINAQKGGTIAGFNISDTAIYNGTDSLTSENSGVYIGTDGIRQYASSNANVTISNGILDANGANISGEIIATSGSFTNGSFDSCTINETCTIKGKLNGVDGTFIGTVKGGIIEGGSLLIGDEDGYYAWISEDGILNANGANITGTINAVNGDIAGWKITSEALYKRNAYGISSGMCSTFGDTTKIGTDGLSYTLSSDGTYYTISGIGTCGKNTEIVIPSIYNNKPVKSIGSQALSYCRYLINTIIPDSITTIGNSAFAYTTTLTNVSIPDSITSIGAAAFDGCVSLASIIIPNTVTNIGARAFQNCHKLTIYVEATSKPSGWDTNWNISGCNVVWGYNGSSANNDASWSPRFFAGSYLSMPKTINDAKFLVLEDGSLYATAANIKGTINATSGSFKGEINAESGKIGGLTIQSNSISSGENGLTFATDIIKAPQIEATNYLSSNKLKVRQLSGINSSSACLDFEGVDSQSRSVTVEFDINIIDRGSAGFLGMGWEQGSMEITATANYDLSVSKTFSVDLVYGEYGYGAQTTKTIYITIPSGSNSGSVVTVYRIGGDDDYCITTSIPNQTFTENTGSDVKAITSTGSILPSTGYLNLGSLNSPWENIYINDTYFLGGGAIELSDRNKKNTVEPITEQYSALFDMLNPVTFKFNDGDSGRTHIGLIAQEVKESMDICGIDSQNFAAYCSWKDDDGNEVCGVRYGELISLCIDQIQKLKKRVAELENK